MKLTHQVSAHISQAQAFSCQWHCHEQDQACFTTPIPEFFFRHVPWRIDYSIKDLSWLLLSIAKREKCLGVPRVASNVPVMVIIWEEIAMLKHEANPFQVRSDAAQSFVSLAQYDDRAAKTIIEEGGVETLLKFIQEAPMKGKESAARAIGLLACDQESVEYMTRAGVCNVYVKILREGPMKVQAAVAWALSVLVNQDPKCQDNFAQHDVVPLLVNHLALETDGNANEHPQTKANIKAKAAIALWKLGKGTPFAIASQNQKHCYLSQCFFGNWTS